MIPEIFHFDINCNIVTIGTKTYYYSYHTLIGFKNENDKIRVAPVSKTTAGHILKMGIKEFPVVSQEEFIAFIEKSL